MLHPRGKSREKILQVGTADCTHFSVCALKSNLALAGLIWRVKLRKKKKKENQYIKIILRFSTLF